MRTLRQNAVLFDLLSLDLSYEGWKEQQRLKELDVKNKGNTFAMREGEEEDEDQTALTDWLFGDKPLPEAFQQRPTVWKRTPPPANVDEMDEDDDFEEMNSRLKNWRERG